MFSGNNVSVVIPSYNSRETIDDCLQSIFTQTVQPLEVILVDSSENEETASFVTAHYPQVGLKRLKKRTFPGPARNLGAARAQGSIIAFIDADCIADPNWIANLVRCHNEGHLVVGGAVVLGNPHSTIAWAGHLGEFREFLPVGEARYLPHIPTCNISYRKAIFESMGGFPDAYYPQEDLLFNYMLTQHGIRIWFDPTITVRNFCREDLKGFLSHQHRIGRVTRSTLRRVALEGSWVARRGWLAWMASPLLGLIKLFRTMAIFTANFPTIALSRPALLFFLFLGSTWWVRGFAAGARKGLSGIRGWNDPDEPIFGMMLARPTSDQK